MVDMTLKQYDL